MTYLFLFSFLLPQVVWADTPKEDEVQQTPQETFLPQEEPQIRVRLRGRRIQTMKLEDYLAGVIGNEMGKKWPEEALKAQTVAARSYAIKQIEESREQGRKFDIVTTQADQVFRLRDLRHERMNEIVAMTRGQVLAHDGRIVEAFYSSTCGGKSRTASEADLTQDSPFKPCKKDKYCEISPYYKWGFVANLDLIAQRLKARGIEILGLKSVKIKKKYKSGYVEQVVLKGENKKVTLDANHFRRAMGWMNVKSLAFKIKKAKHGVKVEGHGFGHGVGLCQFGAKAMALKGKSFDEILAYYYRDVDLVKAYQ